MGRTKSKCDDMVDFYVYCFEAKDRPVYNASDMCCLHNGDYPAHNQHIGYNSIVLYYNDGDWDRDSLCHLQLTS